MEYSLESHNEYVLQILIELAANFYTKQETGQTNIF